MLANTQLLDVCVCVCVCTVYLSPTGSMSLSVQLAYKQATVYLGIRKSLVKLVHTVAIWEEPNRKPECSTTLTSTVKRKVAHVRKDSYYKSRNQDYAYICRQARQW